MTLVWLCVCDITSEHSPLAYAISANISSTAKVYDEYFLSIQSSFALFLGKKTYVAASGLELTTPKQILEAYGHYRSV